MERYFTLFNNYFHGIIAGPLLIFVFLFLQMDSGRLNPPLPAIDYTVISAIALLVNLGYYAWVFNQFKKDRNRLIGKYDLKKRLEEYRTASIRFYVLMTLSGIFAIVAIFLTGELTFGFIYLVQLFLLSVYRPSLHNICKYLNLKGEERKFVLKKREFDE